MDVMECIKTRMSIRKFKKDPVPKDILIEIIDTARWSPSYKNSQPWQAMFLSGAKKDSLSKMLVDLLEKDTKPCPDLPEPVSWPQPEASRIDGLLKKRAEFSGVDLNDPRALKKAKKVNFLFYGAPHVLFLYQDASLSLWSLFDLGLFAQSIMLAARARGVGTVPQAFATDYAEETKKYLGIPDTKRLVLGISMGYPDLTSEINTFRTDRMETGEILQWKD